MVYSDNSFTSSKPRFDLVVNFKVVTCIHFLLFVGLQHKEESGRGPAGEGQGPLRKVKEKKILFGKSN